MKLRALLGMLLLALAGGAGAATIAADSNVLAATPALTQGLPASQTFTVAAAGDVDVVLADLGAPAAFSTLQLVVTRNGARVVRLDIAGTVRFAAQPGDYRMHVVGAVPSDAGTFNVQVTAVSSGAVLLNFSDGMVAADPAANPAQSLLDTTFTISQPGNYQVVLTDHAFPAALSTIDLILLRQGGGTAAVMNAPGTSASFAVASAGTYSLVVAATAATLDEAGLYSVAVIDGTSTVYGTTQAVGRLPSPTAVTFPSAGNYSLTLNDFAVPAALTALQTVVVQNQTVLAFASTAGTTALTASAGDAQLFSFGRRATSSAGSYGWRLFQGAQTVAADARPVPEGYVNGFGGYRYPLTAASGSHQFQLRDHAFPVAFTGLRAVLSQNGAPLQSLSGTESVSITLVAGPATALVLAQPPTATSSNSLFGVSLTPASGAALLSASQGVGGLFNTHTLTLDAAGSYDFTLTDLGFPVQFAELAGVLTQGTSSIGQIFGGGKFTFSGNPGSYSLNVLARLPNGVNYGSYGYLLEDTPEPTLTLTATPTSITSQQTTSLQWSATNATSCTASGSWSGARSTNGSETVGPFGADASFTLQCSGPGGSVTGSTSVTVTQPAGSGGGGGGGGSFDLSLLLGLLSLLALSRAPQRASSARHQCSWSRYQRSVC